MLLFESNALLSQLTFSAVTGVYDTAVSTPLCLLTAKQVKAALSFPAAFCLLVLYSPHAPRKLLLLTEALNFVPYSQPWPASLFQ